MCPWRRPYSGRVSLITILAFAPSSLPQNTGFTSRGVPRETSTCRNKDPDFAGVFTLFNAGSPSSQSSWISTARARSKRRELASLGKIRITWVRRFNSWFDLFQFWRYLFLGRGSSHRWSFDSLPTGLTMTRLFAELLKHYPSTMKRSQSVFDVGRLGPRLLHCS